MALGEPNLERPIFTLVGVILLHARYWKRAKAAEVLKEEFDGDYATAGRILLGILFWQGLAGVLLVMIAGGLIMLIGKTIYDWIRTW